MATQAQQTELLTLLVGMFDAAPTAEIFNGLVAGLDAGATVDQYAEAIAASSYFTDLYADADAFAANFGTALVGEYVSEEVLAVANEVVAARLEAGDSVADVIAFALTALSSDAAANSETWGAAAAALENKVTVAQYFVDTVSGAGYTTVAEMQAILANVTDDAATVEAANAESDALADSINNAGSTFTLTADNDTIVGTSGNDTINGTTTNITGDNDRIIDSSSTDNDVLNITYTGATGPFETVQGIESVNVDMNVFDGSATDFDADNIEGAAITFSSSKLGYNGGVSVINAGDNTVVAGDSVTDIEIASVATDTAINLSVGGDVNATLTGGAAVTDVNITGTATAEVDLVDGALAGSVTDINVTGDVTVAGDAADLTGLTIAGGALSINAAFAAALDAEDFTVSAIEIATAATVSATAAEGQVFNVTEEDVDLTVNTSGDTSSEAVTINVSADQDGGTQLTLGANVDTATVALTSDVAELAAFTYAGATAMTIAGDVTLTDVNETATTDTLTVSGSGAVTLTAVDSTDIDLSGVTGVVTATLDGASQTIETADEADEITLAAAATAAVITNAGNDTVDADLVTTGTVAAELGAGDDTISFDAVAAATIALDGGAGTDTLSLTAADFSTTVTFALVNFENLTTDGASVFNADQLTGKTLAVAGTDEAGDTLTVNAEAGDTVIDLSGLTVASSIDSDVAIVATAATGAVTITGTETGDNITASGNADVINAGAGDDTIVSAAGAESLTGGAGDDTFTLASTEASLDSITDYQAAAATADNDTLGVTAAVVVADIELVDNMDLSTADEDATATDILAIVTDGILTIGGTDAAVIDTLAEWFDAAALASADTTANVLAFEFDGNTYVYEDDNGDAEVASVELADLTGIVAVDTTAAADTILIG